MNIGLLGTGNMAIALGKAWAGAGHRIVVTGRNRHSATRATAQIAARAIATEAQSLGTNVDVIVVAVRWEGLEPALSLLDGPSGALAGRTVIDCTNAVDFTTGDLLPSTGSAAEVVAAAAPGAKVVKALHLFPAPRGRLPAMRMRRPSCPCAVTTPPPSSRPPRLWLRSGRSHS